jgi:hypothetical protein
VVGFLITTLAVGIGPTSNVELAVIPFAPVLRWEPDHRKPTISSSEVAVEFPTEVPAVVVPPTTLRQVPRISLLGTASTYGPGYTGLFALPNPWGRGQRVKICNTRTHRCVHRISNDVGPARQLHRVADLDVATFEYLCECSWTKGLQTVTVEWDKVPSD